MQDKNIRVKASEQNKKDRLSNFNEVAHGYTKEQAILEANRCLNCKTKPCTLGCPVNNDIPDFISKIAEGNIEEAYEIVKNKNNFPAFCGRVCPQEDQCEGNCVRGKKGEALSIGMLERFCADYTLNKEENSLTSSEKEQEAPKVAIIGSGPAGLACSRDLAEMGYDVTVFEALDVLGGILTYGIPKFRLPREIVEREIEYIKKLGVKFITNKKIGKDITIDELFEKGFKAVFLATGANKPRKLNIEGEALKGVYSAYEYLMRINLYEENHGLMIGKRVIIVGGGNVAIDAARASKRLGAEEVTIIYRRSFDEMPARKDEIKHAEEEDIKFMMLTKPIRFSGNEGAIKKIECVKMELGEIDESGRRKPIEIKGSNFIIDVDTVVIAVGQTHDHHVLTEKIPDLQLYSSGGIIVHNETMQTNKEGLFAGGDVVSGGSTVIEAIKAGKKAAKAIDEKLRSC